MDTSENDSSPSQGPAQPPAPSKPKTVGKLVMAATCIGELKDIPLRSLEYLQESTDRDLLVFEEDRPARLFLKAAGVHKPYLKYSEHGENETLAKVAKTLKKGGTVVYMSDQGTPGLADPGRDLVQRAMDVKAQIQVIPGPSSITAALSVCPFDCRSFTYLGLLPRQPVKRGQALKAAAVFEHPVIMIDAPYRLLALLESALKAFGTARRAMLARDISGPQEAYWVSTLDKLLEDSRVFWEEEHEKINFVLIIDGR